jgi:hypothetical protein
MKSSLRRDFIEAIAVLVAAQVNWLFDAMVYWFAAEGNTRALAGR